MQTIDLKKHIIDIFESAEELIEFAQNVVADDNELCGRFLGHSRERFIGRRFDKWPEVYQAIRENWKEGQLILARMLESLENKEFPTPLCRKRKTRFNETDGDELDFDRLRSGRDYWRGTYRENSAGPNTITLMIDVGGNCNKRPEELLWRGAAAIALATILENSGYRVEIWAIASCEDLWKRPKVGWIQRTTVICLKRPEDVLDPSTLINVISGWYFRTIIFRAKIHPRWETDSSLGSHRTPTAEILAEITPDNDRFLIADCWDYRSAADRIACELSKLTHPQPV